MINTNDVTMLTAQDYYNEQNILRNIIAKYDYYNDARS